MSFNDNLKAKTTMTTILLIAALLCAISCKECPTEPDYNIYLTAEDVFCTSVVMNVTLPDSGDVSAFALDRDDSTVATYTCYDDDTLIIDEGLTPDNDYIYRVRFMKDGKTKSESDPVAVHTMDTTSHYFIWEIDTLGNYGSYLKDTWIVDENNIWVVGNIETDSGTYNAAKWDGDKWNIFRISFYYRSDLISTELYSIYYFSENDIWVTTYSFPVHWNGSEWTLYHIQDMGLDASTGFGIWGTSSSNIYFVGRKGSIVHYEGSTFTKMESGIEINFKDIYGNGSEVSAVGYETDGELGGQSVALHFHNGTWSTIRHEYNFYPYNDPHAWGMISTVWAYGKYAYYMSWAGLMKYNPEKNNSEEWFSKYDMNTDDKYIVRIRGNALNDIMLADNWAYFIHYNGQSWKTCYEVYNQLPNGQIDINGMDYKDNLIVAVGELSRSWQAVIIRGIHYQ